MQALRALSINVTVWKQCRQFSVNSPLDVATLFVLCHVLVYVCAPVITECMYSSVHVYVLYFCVCMGAWVASRVAL